MKPCYIVLDTNQFIRRFPLVVYMAGKIPKDMVIFVPYIVVKELDGLKVCECDIERSEKSIKESNDRHSLAV